MELFLNFPGQYSNLETTTDLPYASYRPLQERTRKENSRDEFLGEPAIKLTDTVTLRGLQSRGNNSRELYHN